MSIPLCGIRKLYFKVIARKFHTTTMVGKYVRLFSPHKISIGNNCCVNRNVSLDGRKSLKIGSNVDIGEYSSIWTLQHDPDSDYHEVKGGETVIEDYVWIAPHCIILPGVHIGRGAVLATGSIVTKNVPAMHIVGGIPAKTIGIRKSKLKYHLKYKIYL